MTGENHLIPPHEPEGLLPSGMMGSQQAHHIGAIGLGADMVVHEVETNAENSTEQPPTMEDIPPIRLEVDAFRRSIHLHSYDEASTVEFQERQARRLGETERTAEQQQLLEDVATLREMAPYSQLYKDLYTPAELHQLVTRLTMLRNRNRDDFAYLEDRMADFILGHPVLADEYDRGIVRIVRSAHNAAGNRRMSWQSMSQAAKVSTVLLHDGLRRIKQGEDYIIGIEIDDPIPGSPRRMQPLYQFAASLFAQEVVGARRDVFQQARRETFVRNCEIINAWYQGAQSVIDRLPTEIQGEQLAARWEVGQLVETMNIRLNGTEISGRKKHYKYDVVGAFKLQLRIKNLVRDIRAKLEDYTPSEEFEIIPLDP